MIVGSKVLIHYSRARRMYACRFYFHPLYTIVSIWDKIAAYFTFGFSHY